ncbi:lipopolysaccharide biosynthesis protein [Polynucleobacter sp. MWH-UH25E]|uniref:lipopolysaccharide biosynthesis protein n=1 Tax=Polynucleobacter sp. MWH-UH25E TaxID=1855616 RepID=UPI001BFE3B0E|nr:lipopolysaccharide biosynthesis protein [Polynucleobacter sp. MWH-UH25E]QWD62357.1 lipopolysaccharide biosynthesis protein [Polynucleobacter sp. MWH-UH25E]
MSASRKSIQTLIGQIFIFVQSIALTPIFIKTSGPTVYGAYILLLSYMGLIFGISSLGVGVTAKRFLPSTNDLIERSKLFYPQFNFQMLAVALLGLGSALFFQINIEAMQLQFAGFCGWLIPVYLVAYTLYGQTSDYFRYTHRVGFFNAAIVAQPYIFVVIALGIYWQIGVISPNTLIVSLTIACLFVGLGMFFKMKSEIGFRVDIPKTRNLKNEMVIGFPLVMVFLVDFTLSVGDRYVIAAMMSVKDVGYYVPAYMLGSFIMIVPKVFGVVIPPLISKHMDSGDLIQAKTLSESAASLFLLIAIPYTFGAIVLGRTLLEIYTSSDISEATWQVIPIVALASIFYGLVVIKNNILLVRLRTGTLFKVNLVCSILNIFLNVILLWILNNVVYAAVATLITYVLSYYLLCRKINLDQIDFVISKNLLFNIILSSTIMLITIYCFLFFTKFENKFTNLFLIILGGITFFIVFFGQKSNQNYFKKIIQELK